MSLSLPCGGHYTEVETVEYEEIIPPFNCPAGQSRFIVLTDCVPWRFLNNYTGSNVPFINKVELVSEVYGAEAPKFHPWDPNSAVNLDEIEYGVWGGCAALPEGEAVGVSK